MLLPAIMRGPARRKGDSPTDLCSEDCKHTSITLGKVPLFLSILYILSTSAPPFSISALMKKSTAIDSGLMGNDQDLLDGVLDDEEYTETT